MNLLEQTEALLGAARSPDDTAPRAEYVAAARVKFDALEDHVRTLRGNLCSLEACLLGKSAILEPKKEGKK